MTLNKKMRLDYESLRLPETSILKWSGYIVRRSKKQFTLLKVIKTIATLEYTSSRFQILGHKHEHSYVGI